jgi:methylamine dehydrogenase accessory protein MauD
MTLYDISLLLSWLAIAILGVIVLALARQVGVLHERLAPIGALTIHRGPKVGEMAPLMHTTSLNGTAVELGGPREHRVGQLLLFVAPECPICKKLLSIVKSFVETERLAVVLVGDGDAAEQYSLSALDFVNDAQVGIRYGVGKVPYAVLIDRVGKLTGAGLVNSREHLESLVVAQETGHASIQAYQRAHAPADS